MATSGTRGSRWRPMAGSAGDRASDAAPARSRYAAFNSIGCDILTARVFRCRNAITSSSDGASNTSTSGAAENGPLSAISNTLPRSSDGTGLLCRPSATDYLASIAGEKPRLFGARMFGSSADSGSGGLKAKNRNKQVRMTGIAKSE